MKPYIFEPCMIGDSATMSDAEAVAQYLSEHGCPSVASGTEGAINGEESAPSDELWSAACDHAAEINGWN